MVSLTQLQKKERSNKFHKNFRPSLKHRPQLRGICIRVRIMKPKKPNSAQRKVARLRLSTNQNITAAIPGQGHTLQQYSVVLIRGGRVRDLPGIKYKIIRGVYDALGIVKRGKRRSKFGTRNWKKEENEKKNT